METVNFVFQTDSKIITNTFRFNPNYLIEYDENVDSPDKYCAIYFSSNDIYYPNNVHMFKVQIVERNRFEWYNTRVKRGSKHIFIRDIKKQWYLNGINEKLNSIEKVVEFLRTETKGYKTIAIGSSAGGFAAVLFGSLLNAETIYSFNGQFLLNDLLKRSTQKTDPIIFREKDNPAINKYYSLRPYVNGSKIFYFFSNRSACDVNQFKHVSDLQVNYIPFRTSHHGIPFLKSSLNYVINYPINELEKLSNKLQSPLLFSLKIEGPVKTMLSITKQTYKYLNRKIFNS
ncbi:hypothetical protein OU798_23100 [Prolixibacteraceae bacterium Z1-6]|uniref:Uncharacterized protein n=1 Tax=Draconibacterium aestuarii TaxID=2998507 RepID=A0A9X3J963_9BACT|nr:hypothetical protein [Prolixibacteraceae bacterium Z1-6]